jgi:hypothetical protein
MKNLKRAMLLALAFFAAGASAYAQAPDSVLAVKYGGLTRFRVNNNGGALFGGDFTFTYNPQCPAGAGFVECIPAQGAGTRMMWYPEKAAFRAGYINGTQWDDANIGLYSVAMGEGVRASGDNGVAMGVRSTAAGSSSFAVGEDNTASGAASVAFGYHAHTNARQGSFVFGDRSTVDSIRAGVNHSANWRVSGGFRIFTSSNLSTGVTIQSGTTTSNWGQTNAVISTSTGAYLSTSGVWTNVSDVNRKHAFREISGEDVLIKLRALPVRSWSYRVDDATVRHIGPTSQDFHAAFGLGTDPKAIGSVDADGVALAGVQALDVRTLALRNEMAALKARNDELQRTNDELKARLDRIEALLQEMK